MNHEWTKFSCEPDNFIFYEWCHHCGTLRSVIEGGIEYFPVGKVVDKLPYNDMPVGQLKCPPCTR